MTRGAVAQTAQDTEVCLLFAFADAEYLIDVAGAAAQAAY